MNLKRLPLGTEGGIRPHPEILGGAAPNSVLKDHACLLVPEKP